jgi:hypothetical protein
MISRTYLCILFGILASSIFAQEYDTQGWLGIGVGKRLLKNLEIIGGTQRRYESNISTYFGSYHNLELKYEPIDNLFIRPSIRLADKTDGQVWRYGIEIVKRIKISKYSLDISQLTFKNFADWGADNDDTMDQYEWRSELNNKYKITKNLKASLGGVLFVLYKNDPLDISRFRIISSLDYDIIRNLNLKLGLIRQYDYKKNNILKKEIWIPRIDVSYEF